MSKLAKLSLFTVILALALGISAAPALAGGDTFDVTVKHAVNGELIGLDEALPVDVYLNGGYAFTFEYRDSVSTALPAGNYFVEVKLAGTDTTVMTLGPTDIPAGVDVSIKAILLRDGTPVLKARVN